MKKIILSHLKLFILLLGCGITLLYAVSFLPQSVVDKNPRNGRDDYYSKDYPLFRLTEQGNYATYIDNGMDEVA